MASDFLSRLEHLESGITSCIQHFEAVDTAISDINYHKIRGQWAYALQDCMDGLAALRDCIDLSFQHFHYPYDDYSIIQVLWEVWYKAIETPPPAAITWKAICEAWIKNDFEGRFWTIGIIDRMRQLLWDEPFDLTWAARPEQKEL